jgi:pyruvate kinase
MEALLKAGLNVARFNFSHGTHEEQLGRITMMRAASKKTGIPVALLLDTKGPEIRTGLAKDGKAYSLESGNKVIVTTNVVECTSDIISISYTELPAEVKAGNRILIADGLIDLLVTDTDGRANITCKVQNGGILGSRKNVNVPGIKTKLPAITDKDRVDIRFAIEHGMDFIAASFVRKPSDILEIQGILAEYDSPIRVIAKIEDQEGLDNIKEIVRVAHGIMVARGDLGVQLKSEEIPLAQKRIIELCNRMNKPVITATQMLDSMISNPQPTRAETNDVANAIFDGTDAVMLSGETANGSFPIKAVETMAAIATTIESSPEYRRVCRELFFAQEHHHEIGMAVARAAHLVAEDIHAEAMVAPTLRGNTPKLISKFRPPYKVIAATVSETVQRQLLLHWGVYPLLTEFVRDSELMIQNALRLALKNNLIQMLDKVVTAAGIPLNSPIMINTIKVHFIGNILNRGHHGFGEVCSGKIVKARNAQEAIKAAELHEIDILLTPSITHEYLPMLPKVHGIILEHRSEIPPEELVSIRKDLVLIADVKDALRQFEAGQFVSLDGEEKIIYEGLIEG